MSSFFIDTTGVQLDIPPDIYFGPARGAHQRSSCISPLGYDITTYRFKYSMLLDVDAESDSDVLSDSELSLDVSDSDSESELDSLDE